MPRQTLPTFDDPPRCPYRGKGETLSLRLCVAAALLSYVIAAVNLLGPRECATQALTPACAVAVVEAVTP
jgi:hypothetical protein